MKQTMPNIENVFDAGGFPEYTYVERERRRLEDRLIKAMESSTPGVSIIGPSKSGKTVLVKNVSQDMDFVLMHIRGPSIDSVDDFWNTVLDGLNEPDTIEEHVSDSMEDGSTTTGGLKASGTGIDHSSDERHTKTTGQTRSYDRDGLRDVIARANNTEFMLLLDDFHYISNDDVKRSIAQSMKGAIEESIRICVAFVTHRGETLQQLVPDLDSRVMTIRCDLWEKQELARIIEEGESELNIQFPEWLKTELSHHAIGSPMVMQRLCAAACNVGGVSETREQRADPEPLDVSKDELSDIISSAADWMGKRGVVRGMAGGVNDSGRVEYDYGGNEDGDTYILGLRAIANGTTTRQFAFQDLKERIREDCVDSYPNAPQIENFCRQMANIAEERRPGEDLVEWDSENKMLLISDPELLFLVRYLMRDDDFQDRLLMV